MKAKQTPNAAQTVDKGDLKKLKEKIKSVK